MIAIVKRLGRQGRANLMIAMMGDHRFLHEDRGHCGAGSAPQCQAIYSSQRHL